MVSATPASSIAACFACRSFYNAENYCDSRLFKTKLESKIHLEQHSSHKVHKDQGPRQGGESRRLPSLIIFSLVDEAGLSLQQWNRQLGSLKPNCCRPVAEIRRLFVSDNLSPARVLA